MTPITNVVVNSLPSIVTILKALTICSGTNTVAVSINRIKAILNLEFSALKFCFVCLPLLFHII